MNKYKLQYWIYVILNRQFGKEVHFRRDSLHRIYEVNRHSFEVATNTQNINTVKRWLVDKLVESGYNNTLNEPNYYIKEIGNKSYCITISQQDRGLDYKFSSKPVILVSIFAHTIYRKT